MDEQAVPVRKVQSNDGTAIAFDQSGDGPPVILVGSAFNDRSGTAPLAAALAARLTVFNYDRRGRGDSGRHGGLLGGARDPGPRHAHRPGRGILGGLRPLLRRHPRPARRRPRAGDHQAGALRAALPGRPEPPTTAGRPAQAARRADLRRSPRDAVELYQTKYVGIPEDVVAQLRHAPFRPALEAIAHTLVYDATIIGDLSFPTDLVAKVATPTLVIDGEHSMPMLRNAAQVLADTLPNGRPCTLAGQSHDISPEATAPVLLDFFSS